MTRFRRRACVFVGLIVTYWVATASLLAQKADGSSTDERLQRIEESLRTLTAQVTLLTERLKPQQSASVIQAVEGVQLSLGGASRKGAKSAKVVLIEFSDFQCPFCGRHAQSTYRAIEKEYIVNGRIQYVFRHFPLEHIHPAARQAAEAAVCAEEQQKFWEFHDRLFLNQTALTLENLREHAKAVQLDFPEFDRCVTQRRTASNVNSDFADARRLNINATPGFLIGELGANGDVRVLKRIVGAQPIEIFRTALDDLLGSPR